MEFRDRLVYILVHCLSKGITLDRLSLLKNKIVEGKKTYPRNFENFFDLIRQKLAYEALCEGVVQLSQAEEQKYLAFECIIPLVNLGQFLEAQNLAEATLTDQFLKDMVLSSLSLARARDKRFGLATSLAKKIQTEAIKQMTAIYIQKELKEGQSKKRKERDYSPE